MVKFRLLNDLIELFGGKLISLKLLEKVSVNPQMLTAWVKVRTHTWNDEDFWDPEIRVNFKHKFLVEWDPMKKIKNSLQKTVLNGLVFDQPAKEWQLSAHFSFFLSKIFYFLDIVLVNLFRLNWLLTGCVVLPLDKMNEVIQCVWILIVLAVEHSLFEKSNE